MWVARKGWCGAAPRLPTVDLWTVQLVRDPRGYLLSRRRRDLSRERRDRGPGPTFAFTLWSLNHVVAEAAGRTHRRGRYVLLRYEDFARQPLPTGRALVRLTGELETAADPLPANQMHLRPNHMIAGNCSRLNSGVVEIVPDEAWRDQLPRRARSQSG